MLPTRGLWSHKAFLSQDTRRSRNLYLLLPLQQEQHLPLPPVLQVEEKEESKQEEEGFVDLTVFTNNYEVFNQPSPSQNEPEDVGIQRKPQRSLQELLESQPGRGEAGKPSQPQLPPPPPKSPPRAPQPPSLSRVEQVNPKRRKEPKGKEVMEPGRPRSSLEEEAHRPTKQQKTSHAPSRGSERGDVQLPEPHVWLLAPMLGGEPLTDDASIRDYNGSIGCHVASVLEETLLLPRDMVELRGLRRNEVFLQTKRFLGMVRIYLFTVFSFFLFDITLILFFLFF